MRDDQLHFTCPACGRTSWHPEDVRQGYCVSCHDWTGGPMRPGVPNPVCFGCGQPPMLIDAEALAPLLIAPGVSASTRKPFLTVLAGDMEVGQWTVDDARRHALFTLEVAEAVDLDQALFDWLVSDDFVGVDEGRARQVVASIANHR